MIEKRDFGIISSIASTKFKIIKIIFKCIIFILVCEILQFITCLGFFDIDDIVINTFSCFLGIILYLIFTNIICKNSI